MSEGEIGFVAAASTIVGIIVNFTAGSLSDIYGRKKLLIASGLFFASAPPLYLFVTNAWQLALVRAYHGIATATFTPVAISFVADMYRSRRGEMMGFFSSATMIGRLSAPILAGSILTLAGFRETYLACWLFGSLALISLLLLPSSREKREIGNRSSAGRSGHEVMSVLLRRDVLAASSLMAITYFALQGLETFLPLYMEAAGFEAWLIGTLFTVQLLVMMLLKPYAGMLSDKMGRVKTTAAGLATSALGLILLAYSRSYLELVLSMIVFAVGVSLTTASIPPLISELVNRETYGSAIGSMETIKDVGQALGPIAVGLMLPYTRFEGVLLALSFLMLLSLLAFFRELKS